MDVFLRFLKCTNDVKPCKASHTYFYILLITLVILWSKNLGDDCTISKTLTNIGDHVIVLKDESKVVVMVAENEMIINPGKFEMILLKKHDIINKVDMIEIDIHNTF